MIRAGSIHFLLFVVLVFLAPSSRAREFACAFLRKTGRVTEAVKLEDRAKAIKAK